MTLLKYVRIKSSSKEVADCYDIDASADHLASAPSVKSVATKGEHKVETAEHVESLALVPLDVNRRTTVIHTLFAIAMSQVSQSSKERAPTLVLPRYGEGPCARGAL